MRNQIIKLIKPLVEQFPQLAMAYRTMRDNLQAHEEPKPTPYGFKLAGNPAMQQGQFEPEETRIVNQLLAHADIFINVGANIGYYCCFALQQGKYAIAFEPMHGNLRYLFRNIQANHWQERIEVFPMAASDQVGVLEIYGSGTGASLLKGWANTPEHFVTLVPANTLNNALGSRFQGKRCFILADVEGVELSMLRGASTLLQLTPKPIWMLEIAITEHQPKGTPINPQLLQTFEIFWNNGYEAWTADRTCRKVLPPEVEAIAQSGIDTLQIHNFLFIEEGKKNELFGA